MRDYLKFRNSSQKSSDIRFIKIFCIVIFWYTARQVANTVEERDIAPLYFGRYSSILPLHQEPTSAELNFIYFVCRLCSCSPDDQEERVGWSNCLYSDAWHPMNILDAISRGVYYSEEFQKTLCSNILDGMGVRKNHMYSKSRNRYPREGKDRQEFFFKVRESNRFSNKLWQPLSWLFGTPTKMAIRGVKNRAISEFNR